MRIKSYFAKSVEEAMDKARRELGPEAMLMNSKKTELELRSLGAYEVVFAVAPEVVRAAEIQAVDATSKSVVIEGSALESHATSDDLGRELAELRKQIETVKRSVDRRPPSQPGPVTPLSAEGVELIARLRGAELSEELAMELATAIEIRRARDGAASSVEAALRTECEQRLRFAPALAAPIAKPCAILFVGPPGAGKTTTLVKLALRYGLRARLPLQLLSLDTLRIGGWEQLACYARIAGIPCQALHTPAALAQAFIEYGNKKLLLIDTPGFSPADEAQVRNLAAGLAAHRESVDVHLVLSATVQPRIHLATIERFAAFGPAKLLFTHLDETDSPGPVLETALRASLPLSFLAKGQQVPEDINEASLDRLLGSLVAGRSHGSRRVASAA